jgi:hypothetical protein
MVVISQSLRLIPNDSRCQCHGRFSVPLFADTASSIERGRNRGMTDMTSDDLHRYAVDKSCGGERVPQALDTDGRQPESPRI